MEQFKIEANKIIDRADQDKKLYTMLSKTTKLFSKRQDSLGSKEKKMVCCTNLINFASKITLKLGFWTNIGNKIFVYVKLICKLSFRMKRLLSAEKNLKLQLRPYSTCLVVLSLLKSLKNWAVKRSLK